MRRISPDGVDVTENFGAQGPRDEIRMGVEDFRGVVERAVLGDWPRVMVEAGKYCGPCAAQPPELALSGREA